MPLKPRPLTERLRERIKIDPETGCHLWIGGRSSSGYGAIYIDGQNRGVHRVRYELERGPIPPGLHIDHLCRNPACCNPAHLEPVTPRENILRSPVAPPALNAVKTHCPEGHELAGDNLDSHALKHGRRACKECMRRRCREWHQRNRDKRLAAMRDYKAARKGCA